MHEQHGKGEDWWVRGVDGCGVCPCRSTDLQKECALSGCGFCKAAEAWSKGVRNVNLRRIRGAIKYGGDE